jgi:hypothetical protein
MKIIYRKRDRAIVGHVFPRRNESEDVKALTVELENILNSDLSGMADDYGYLEVSEAVLTPGLELQITEDLKVISRESQRTIERKSALQKLKGLGLTDAEVAAIA